MKKLMLLLLAFIVSGCSKEEVYQKNLFLMDTNISVKVYSEVNADKSLEEIEETFNYYNKLFDRFNEYDDLVNVYSINNNRQLDEIDEELIKVLDIAINLKKDSNNLFDVCSGELYNLWRLAIREGELPILPELINKECYTVEEGELVFNDVDIDLGGIAKGYVSKVVSEQLKEDGFNKFLINAGGQVTVGDRYRDLVYQVGVKQPNEKELLIVNLENKSISSTGDYERFFVKDGKTYSHVINPMTNQPGDIYNSVSVIASDSLISEYLSTTLFLMEINEALDFVKSYDAEAIFYLMDGNIIRTEGFSKYE